MTIYQEAIMRAAIARRESILTAMPLTHVPTKRTVKTAKKSFRALARESQPDCMLNMPRPAGHRLVPKIMDDRTKALFASHEKRKETWKHG